uniref:Uncharacterized protein n=1 Tax=Nelumbo nucifera TaxID=4432 RepID=A0A822YPN0_NELNU|nr:TPA_asm: hypothetical protein HUJ06_004693 [Nelumbo nucifera]
MLFDYREAVYLLEELLLIMRYISKGKSFDDFWA